MSTIAIFGAGGRAGRAAVAEAAARGHRVTAVVRHPSRYPDLAGERVSVVAGDSTDAASVAAVAAGHDGAIGAAIRLDVPAGEYLPAAARALASGLTSAGVGRLVFIGIGTTLETAPGVPVHDAPDFPAEYRAFSLGHAAALDVFAGTTGPLDWLVVAPPPTLLDADGPRTGRYRIGGRQVLPDIGDGPFRYADLAVALLDEIDTPRHHRTLVAVNWR
ncbi:MAG: NAD(P)-dependent oxidoreductase [Mycobacteriales bacterium]